MSPRWISLCWQALIRYLLPFLKFSFNLFSVRIRYSTFLYLSHSGMSVRSKCSHISSTDGQTNTDLAGWISSIHKIERNRVDGLWDDPVDDMYYLHSENEELSKGQLPEGRLHIMLVYYLIWGYIHVALFPYILTFGGFTSIRPHYFPYMPLLYKYSCKNHIDWTQLCLRQLASVMFTSCLQHLTLSHSQVFTLLYLVFMAYVHCGQDFRLPTHTLHRPLIT